jgi:heat-inducible transcriptional repressor
VLELSVRARRILYATVTEYIATRKPVGSRKLARRCGLKLSPASVRNVLADLEEAGYLVQPHTSAGRLPTDKGFRALVDALVRVDDVPTGDKRALMEQIRDLEPGRDDIAGAACRLLSNELGAASILHAPLASDEHLKELRFVPLRAGELLAVLVTRSGRVENRVVSIGRDPSDSELERLHNYLSEQLGERSLMQLRALVASDAARERDQLKERARDVVNALVASDGRRPAPRIEGRRALLHQPDFTDVDKMRGVLDALDDKERLMELLDQTLAAGGVQVLIGAETELAKSDGLSLISASYSQAGTRTGTLGVLVPTRTDYRSAVPLVGFAASVVSSVLDGDFREH